MTEEKNLAAGALLLVDKPYRWSSFDVVKKLRGALKIKKIGHAGTLDPLATGLLIICTGKKTKEIQYFQNMEKEYRGTLVLGKTTPSIDLETEFDSNRDYSHLSSQDITEAAGQFQGKVSQIPPRYSAVKVDGQPVYKKARKGEEVILKPREVEVSIFEITSCQLPSVEFRVVCSKGTYIRSLVRDLGLELGCGAYLSALIRTRIGPYGLEQASSVDELTAQMVNSDRN